MGEPDRQAADRPDGALVGSPAAIRLVDDLVEAARGLKAGRLDERAFEERLKDLWGAWLERLGEEDD